MTQPDLFQPRTIVEIAHQHADEMSAEFLVWLPDNLHVWEAFVREVFKVKGRGFTHYSSRTIIEFLRHHSSVTEVGSQWKINDHNVPYLPRLFDIVYPQHAGLFEYRTTTKKKGNE